MSLVCVSQQTTSSIRIQVSDENRPVKLKLLNISLLFPPFKPYMKDETSSRHMRNKTEKLNLSFAVCRAKWDPVCHSRRSNILNVRTCNVQRRKQTTRPQKVRITYPALPFHFGNFIWIWCSFKLEFLRLRLFNRSIYKMRRQQMNYKIYFCTCVDQRHRRPHRTKFSNARTTAKN